MDVFDEYKKLKVEFEFKKFLRDNSDYYLVHVLVPETLEGLEFGFFSPKKDRIVVFKTNPFFKGEEEEVFKEGKAISRLDIDVLKVNYLDAESVVKKICEKDYSSEEIKKRIVLLQVIEVPVWNITLICKSMNIINIRVDALSGEVIRNNKSSLLNMAGVA